MFKQGGEKSRVEIEGRNLMGELEKQRTKLERKSTANKVGELRAKAQKCVIPITESQPKGSRSLTCLIRGLADEIAVD